ncbi:hypothetical protein LI177_10180 [bacterium 210820-DFI.6.37]|nr:hypothetical protein [bacterium 210820-DFI.6.37]
MVEKRLVKSLNVVKKSSKLIGKQYENTILIKTTPQTIFEKDLPEAVKKKLFVLRPEIVSAELCYVPCWRVVLKFSVSYLKKSRSEEGQIEFIVDPIKGCGANEEKFNLKLTKKSIPEEMVSEKNFSKEDAERKATTDARWKVLLNRYKQPAKLETARVDPFYRPYYKTEVLWGSKSEIQYVAADDFANYFVYSS